jgi:glycosyltransferase involved in cell wall biosynthesis
MRDGRKIAVVIPALDEERAIGRVVDAIPDWVDDIVVVDNGSKDGTAEIAADRGARVVREPRRGYGAACLSGARSALATDGASRPRILVFVDGDFSDDPSEMGLLVAPIVDGGADLVIGSRALGCSERRSLTLQQRLGNRLSCALMRFLFGARYTDLGWTVQMQVRAARHGLRIAEVPVSYRRRAAGRSKVSGTVRGAFGAGSTILWVIFREAADAAFERRAPSGALSR